MKEELLAYLNERISWHQQEHARLRREERGDEAIHMQIAINVYNIFLSTYRAVKFDLHETLTRFASVMKVWDESHLQAVQHDDLEKKLVEEIKIGRGLEIIRRAKELEAIHCD